MNVAKTTTGGPTRGALPARLKPPETNLCQCNLRLKYRQGKKLRRTAGFPWILLSMGYPHSLSLPWSRPVSTRPYTLCGDRRKPVTLLPITTI